LLAADVFEAFKGDIARRPTPLSLKAALDGKVGRALIAEIKRASPSKGELGMGWDPVDLARIYEANGAAAISVLTETEYFKGDPNFIRLIRPGCTIPILRKDFILEPIQVYESAALGADALLLIVGLLTPAQFKALLALTHILGLEALAEVHTAAEMKISLAAGARVIGINSRDLRTFKMYPERALELAPMAPPQVTLVAASGLNSPQDLERLEKAGIHAFLVGETLVTEGDPGRKLRELVGQEGGGKGL